MVPPPPHRPQTVAVHAGRQPDPATGGIAAPIHLSTTFERDPRGAGRHGFEYARDANPTRGALENCLAALEAGQHCVAFSSGMAAITAVVECLPDHLPPRLLLPQDMYFGLRALLQATPLGRLFATATVDMTDPDAVQRACAAFKPGVVWIETPSNPLLRVTDIAVIAAIARAAGAGSVVDNTFASPVLQQPLALGADLVVQSVTKYIGGASDLMIGAVIGAAGSWLDAMRSAQTHKGAVPSPFDCWLALRSIPSLPARMRMHCDSAMAVANHLAAHSVTPGSAVRQVNYPGLAHHPGHSIARRQMAGFGGMMSIQLYGAGARADAGAEADAGADAAAQTLAASVRLFTRATSFGDAHSLIEHRPAGPNRPPHLPPGLLRLSIGLEHPQDLIEDLDQALAAAAQTAN